MEGKIESLQAMRGLAFIGIFFAHAGCKFEWAALSVTTFMTLSGFLLMRNRGYKPRCGLKHNILFSWNRIRKLYLLHICTMLVAIAIYLFQVNVFASLKELASLGLKVICNVFLIQTWFPHSSICQSLNGVAWYLSAMAFLYFLFPYIVRWITNKDTKILGKTLVASLLVELLSCTLLVFALGEKSPVYIWFRYYFPILRVPDFFAGCVLGKIYFEKIDFKMDSNKRDRSINWKVSIYEIVLLSITVVICIFAKMDNIPWFMKGIYNNNALLVPLSMGWVSVFAGTNRRGLLSLVLNNSICRYIGNISAAAYLIHYVVIQLSKVFVTRISFVLTEGCMTKWVFIIVELTITLFLSSLYMKKRINK